MSGQRSKDMWIFPHLSFHYKLSSSYCPVFIERPTATLTDRKHQNGPIEGHDLSLAQVLNLQMRQRQELYSIMIFVMTNCAALLSSDQCLSSERGQARTCSDGI